MARAMKDSGIAWIGEIPEEWEVGKAKYYLTISNGSNPNTEGDIPVYGSGASSFKTCGEYKEGPCVLVGRKGATLHIPHYIDHRYWNVDTAFDVKPKQRFSLKYYYYLASCFDYKLYISQTTLPGMTQTNYENMSLPVPEEWEQKRIVDLLDTECARIDAVIEQTRASIEEYKKLKQAVITQAVTKGIRPNRPMKDSGIDWIVQIPEEWDVLRGKWLFHETDERSEDGSEELLTVSHITGVTPRSQKNVNMFMSESLVGYKICRVNDIAANTMWMWQGAIGVSKYHGVISPSYNSYRQTNNQYNPDYLDYLLRIRPLVETYNANSTGITASRLRLYPDQFLSIMFPIPSMEEQIQIADYLNEKISDVELLIEKKERYLLELENYKKSMIFEYVTGKKEA